MEEKKTYDWKKGVKKTEKKEVVEAPKPEKITLKKPKEIEKVKEAAQEGPKLKPIPAKEKVEEEAKEGPKLKPIPQKPKPDEVCIICVLFFSINIFICTSKTHNYILTNSKEYETPFSSSGDLKGIIYLGCFHECSR